MTNQTRSPARLSLRSGLLAGACAIAVIGAGLTTLPGAFQTSPAFAQLQGALPGGPASFADVVEGVKPAVVSVKVKVETAGLRGSGIADEQDEDGFGQDGPRGPQGLPPGFERFFRQFGEPQGRGQGQPQRRPRGQFAQSQGSGFFISKDGYIVTNNHVVQNAVEVAVTMEDGRTLDAKVIGTDPRTDLALLKVKQDGDFPFVRFAKAQPRVGDWVIAVGNPFGLGGTVTAGIVSARGRDIGSGPYDDYLQIDAAVNRGNSGGPTFNAAGEVVGVNTAIYSPSGGNVGIAFAIPAATVEAVVADLKAKGSVSRGFIGVQIQPVTPELADAIGLAGATGALVADASPDGPAARAGIRRGDTIRTINGEAVKDARDLSRRVATFKPGEKVKITVWREGREREISLDVGRQPAA